MKNITFNFFLVIMISLLTLLSFSGLRYTGTEQEKNLKQVTSVDTFELPIDPLLLSEKDTNTKDKTILYIGDSHTTYAYGWQDQLSKLTGMKSTKIAKGGMRTDWMWQNSKNLIAKSNFDYCMIWGGANDAASLYNLDSSISNIQKIINLCRQRGTKVIVLTGFNPNVVQITNSNRNQWGFYPPKYVKLQNKIKTELKGARVVQNWYVTRKDGDCGDFVCHLSASGHRKMALGIYKELFSK